MKNKPTEILAVIPARGGSKGIAHKNIVPLGGKPLLAYTLEAALAAKKLTRVLVSTDDPAIAETARRYGGEVPFLRPAAIAQSDSLLESCLSHVLTGLAATGYSPDALMILYCTSPFRTPALIDALAEKLALGHSQVVTAKRISPGRTLMFRPDRENVPVRPLRLSPASGVHYHRPYGVVTGCSLAPHPELGIYVHYLTDPCMLVDIDTPDDLRLAGRIIERGLFDFGLS